MHLASEISSYGVKDKKTHFYLLFKFSIIFRYVPQNIHGHFQSYFQNGYTQSSEAALLFIALNYLTSAALIANLCSHLIPVHYKTSTTRTSKHTF